MDTEVLIVILQFVLILLILFSIFKGCCCHKKYKFHRIERFANNPDLATEKDEPVKESFTKEEMELFEDIKNNRVKESEINSLISKGILTETLVQKMLNKIDRLPDPTDLPDDEPKPKAKPKAKETKKEKFTNLEGYTNETLENFGDANPSIDYKIR